MSYSLGQSSYVPPTGGLYDYPTTPGGVPSGGLQDPPPYAAPAPAPAPQPAPYDSTAYDAGAWSRQAADWAAGQQYAQTYTPDSSDYAPAPASAAPSSDAAAASIIGVGLLVPLLFFL